MPTNLPGAPPNAAGGQPADREIAFAGGRGDFIRLCVRGAFFQLLTFGFYRFWLTTDIRRHLWSNTSIGGEPLEYTGRAKELLIGFLIALAILVPVQIVYFLIGIQAELLRAFASFPLFLFYILFGQFAAYRARRYRLTRTIWRGVRFWMSGSGWAYAFRWLGWALLVFITLGLVYPWMRAALERYKMANTFYGDLKGEFTGRASDFFKRGIWMWLFCIAPLALLLIAGATTDYLAATTDLAFATTALGIFAFVWMLAIPFVWPYFRALEWRWWAAGARFGELSFASDVRGGALLKIYVKLFLMILLIMLGFGILFGIIAVLAAMVFGGGALKFDGGSALRAAGSISVIVTSVIAYLAVLLTIGILQRFYMTREIWRVISTSLTISHLEASDGVAARGEAANALGEGLADGLDVAGL